MFGKSRKREGYEMIDVDENLPSSSIHDFSMQITTRHPGDEKEPLVHDDDGSQRQAYTYDAPVEHALGGDEVSIQRQTTSADNRWEHIGNPDQFFTRFYQYHQAGGFLCVAAQRFFYLFQYLFVIFFATFLFECVDYQVLFNGKNTTADGIPITRKRRVQDIVLSNCVSHFHPVIIGSLFFAAVIWIFLCVRTGYHLVQFYEIRSFYRRALGIDDESLINLTWSEVLALLCQKLPHLHVIITKDRLNELDVYQRILRYKNYFVALVNKEVLPPVLNLPFIGTQPYLSNGLKLNLDFLFFCGPLSPWERPYTLKEEYKNSQNIDQLAAEMQKSVFMLGFVNLLFMPLIFAYQVLYIFFSYVELVKRDPSAFGKRRYSNYARDKLRHFNELDHELQIRLSRSHEVATHYVNLFASPFIEICAKNVKFVAGSIFAVLFALAAWDEDVLTLEHALTLMTVAFLVVIICNSCISSENRVYMPEQLMQRIISCIHYAPLTWRGKAHTQTVRKEFNHLFPFTAQYILEELFSPVLTPFLLLLWVRPRAKQFVEFFNRYTVSIEGLGDVCSFAQMDFARHKDPRWSNSVTPLLEVDTMISNEGKCDMANDGKTELSLLHFAFMNPGWDPPSAAASFINDLKARAEKDAASVGGLQCDDNSLLASINLVLECLYAVPSFEVSKTYSPNHHFSLSCCRGRAISHLDGPPTGSDFLVNSLQQKGLIRHRSALFNDGSSCNIDLGGAAGEMALSTLYLRQLVNNADIVDERTDRRDEQLSSGAFAEGSSIWGVPAVDSNAIESTLPVLFEHWSGDGDHYG